MSLSDKPLGVKLTVVALPLSIAMYVGSLSMDVATVVGRIDLHSEAIEEQLKTELENNVPTEVISDQISGVIQDVVRDQFPLLANRAMFHMIGGSVRRKVEERGPDLLADMMPKLDIPQPTPDVRQIRLLQTIKDLWATGTTGDRFLAVAITAFTIFFPVSKYIALGWLLFARATAQSRKRVLSWLKSWGQWSMGDVFVVAFTVVFTKINTSVVSTSNLADISVRVGVEPGMYLFAASVVLAMICSMLLTSAEG